MNNFTPEDMIRFLYNEMNIDERTALLHAMESDWTLREKFEVLKKAMLNLDSLHYSPRPEAVASILNYADAAKIMQR